jgi:hypothetical protein
VSSTALGGYDGWNIPEVQEVAQLEREDAVRSAYAKAWVSVASNRIERNRPVPFAGLPTSCPWTWEQICDPTCEPEVQQ